MLRTAGFAVVVAVAVTACGSGGDDDDDIALPDAMEAVVDAATAGPTWASYAQGFFATYCHACHGPGDALRDYSELAMVRAESARIRSGVDSEQFPVGTGPKPTRDERDTLIQWIDDGTPE